MSGALHLTLVRHGTTAWNESGRWQGLTDNPLGPGGEAQARLLRDRLAGETFDQIYASDLTRAVQTAAPLADALDLELQGHVDAYETGGRSLRQGGREVSHQVAEHPVAALLVAGLLGYGLGLLIHGRD